MRVGGFSSGDSFVRRKFLHTSNFGAGPSDMGNFDTPNLWSLVDKWLCETLAGRLTANNSATIPGHYRHMCVAS